MRILHIGDLHFKPKNAYDQNKIQNSLIKCLSSIEKVDFIFFSGDLVFSGSNPNHFKDAHNYLFSPLLTHFKITEKELFICEGNHDIDRGRIVKAIITEFENKSTINREYLENWYKKESNDRNASLSSSQNYYDYLISLGKEEEDIIDNLVSVYVRKSGNYKVGIVTLNSSWFSADREDKNQLLFLPDKLEEAISRIQKCEFKIVMQHHPLSFYKENLSFTIQDLIHSNFNILLTGHVHKEYVETRFKNNNGIYCNTTKASLCYDGGKIGFSIIEVNLADCDHMKIQRYHYIQSEDIFASLDDVIVPIPSSEERFNLNVLRKKILNLYYLELKQANQLLLEYNEDEKSSFLDTFTEPHLSKSSDEQSTISDITYKLTFNELKENDNNYLIFGKDKCGKTSLLKKLLLDFLHDYADLGKIPIFIDYKHLETGTEDFNVIKLLTTYYSINKKEAEKIVERENLILLIDNIDTGSPIHNQIINFLSENRKIRFIACSEYLTSRIFAEELDHLEYDKIFFKKLGRTEIRNYAKKLSNIKVEEHEIIIDKVTQLCKQLQLPANFWTISLIILIYKKGNDDYTKNLFSILDSCVDEMLQKKRFIFEKNDVKFEQYKTLCSQIAFGLYSDHRDKEYSATDSEIINIIQEYKLRNPRVIISSSEIFNFLHESGFFKKKYDGNFTFRLNGIFEYFLAYYIKENEDFKNSLIASNTAYLDFKNELEIYSGFNRADKDFLNQIFTKTKIALDSFHNSYKEDMDKLLDKKIDLVHGFELEVKKMLATKALSNEDRDIIYDNYDDSNIDSDVHVKREVEINTLNVEIVEKYLAILARVFKNSDSITDSKLIYDIFNYLLDSYCRFGFYLIDQYKEMAEKENLKANEETDLGDNILFGEELLNLLSRIVPVLAQVMFYDGIGHENFSLIIENKIKELRLNASVNQYKLFVLYFLLLDIDIKGNKNLIEDVFAEITMAPLKVSTLFKLNFYLAFKTPERTPLEQYFKNKVQAAEKRLDKKLNVDDLQYSLSGKTKRKLIRKKK